MKFSYSGAQVATTVTAAKTSLKNEHSGNGDYFVIQVASSSHPIFLTEHAANGLVEAPVN